MSVTLKEMSIRSLYRWAEVYYTKVYTPSTFGYYEHSKSSSGRKRLETKSGVPVKEPEASNYSTDWEYLCKTLTHLLNVLNSIYLKKHFCFFSHDNNNSVITMKPEPAESHYGSTYLLSCFDPKV